MTKTNQTQSAGRPRYRYQGRPAGRGPEAHGQIRQLRLNVLITRGIVSNFNRFPRIISLS